MNKLLIASLLAATLTGCVPASEKTSDMENQKEQHGKTTAPDDSTPRVTGIGGVFFYCDNPNETKDWYAKNLGVEINDWGSAGFDYRNANHPDEIVSLQWKPFRKGDAYFSPSKKEFMINYTVQNIEALIQQLRENGVTILDTLESYDYGKFIHIMDADGNKIELWEPAKSNP